MKKLIITLGFLFNLFQCLGHDINSVYFKIEEKSNEIHISTDLPWTIRHELETFNTKLKKTKTKLALNKTLQNYIKTYLKLWSSENYFLKLITIEEIKNTNVHSHGTTYRFIFEKGPISKVENSILLLTNKKQKNISVIKINGKWNNYITNKENRFFRLSHSKKNFKFKIIGLLTIVCILAVLIFIEIKKVLMES